MIQAALSLYDYFEKHRRIFWLTFIALLLLLATGASRIKIEEDITKFFPDDKKTSDLNYVFQNSKFAEQMVIMVSMRDSAAVPQPDSLTAAAAIAIAGIEVELKPFIRKITSRVDDDKVLSVFNSIYEHLPIFLTPEDYQNLDTALQPAAIRQTLSRNYNQLISPVGMALKRIIVRDPLGISFLPLQKLKGLQYDENFELYDGYIVTRDHRHLLFFITPAYPPIETGNNTQFIAGLNTLLTNASGDMVQLTSFGASAVAVGNAVQLRRDTVVTVGLMVIILGAFLIGFFKKKRVPFLIFIPVVFGSLFSLCCIFLMKGSVSILALAAGSVILGIAVNYALHFLAHLKHTGDVRQVIADLVSPMTLGSTTTVLAFFCLQFTNAAVLRDVGLFAGFSLIGAALCSLIFLPHFLPAHLFPAGHGRENFIERIPFARWASKPPVVAVILLATPVFFYFAGHVTFDNDVSKLNYMSAETLESQHRLESINRSAESTIFVVSREADLEHALRKNETTVQLLDTLKRRGLVRKISSVSAFLISDSLQRQRIRRWNQFWTPQRKAEVFKTVRTEAARLKFSDVVIGHFESLVTTAYQPIAGEEQRNIQSTFFDDYIITKDSTNTVVTLASVDPSRKKEVYDYLKTSSSSAFDRQMMANLFVEYVNADFNFIVTFTAILVFIALLISYGRIELTLITFVPMFITWIWILGIMALVHIQFNIVNVMVSTFIFGLGDDYSIFIMDGLQQEYQTGKKNLPSIRTSIFLSAVTTITGLGVLFFAHHPAMRSIAAISIIGILSVFVMSQTIEPWLFTMLITRRTEKGLPPKTLSGMNGTLATYGTFLTGSFVMTAVGLLLKCIPFGRRHVRWIYHAMLRATARLVIYLEIDIHKKYIGMTRDTLRTPCVLIANHSSVIDILLTVMQKPKLILITNEWVWNSPVLGGVARLADYYSVAEGVETGHDKLRRMVGEGYSIVIFPEGTRSPDGKIQRFHKGAFYLAEQLGLPVQPMLIHGAGYSSPKGTFYLSPGQFTMKFLPLIMPSDTSYGNGYAERTKAISRYFKREYAVLAGEIETQDFFAPRLISNYIYKGPILEWYLRVKLRLEKNYADYYNLLPRTGSLLDLGCGYGFLCHLLHLRSPEQPITGVDYDVLKVDVARHSYLCKEPLKFIAEDITTFEFGKYSGIVVSDVLHYLKPGNQQILLERCFNALAPGGVLMVRDANTSLAGKHGWTRLTEFLSIDLLKFNKSENRLTFLAAEKIVELATARGLTTEIRENSKLTSNVLIVIRRAGE